MTTNMWVWLGPQAGARQVLRRSGVFSTAPVAARAPAGRAGDRANREQALTRRSPWQGLFRSGRTGPSKRNKKAEKQIPVVEPDRRPKGWRPGSGRLPDVVGFCPDKLGAEPVLSTRRKEFAAFAAAPESVKVGRGSWECPAGGADRGISRPGGAIGACQCRPSGGQSS